VLSIANQEEDVMKSRSTIYAGTALVAATLALAACGSSSASSSAASSSSSSTGAASTSAAPTKAPIKIGNIGGYSGFNAEGNKAAEAAVTAWVDTTNAHGGINGHPIQLFVKDDGGVPAKSVTAVKDLVENDHVVAIVGVHAGGDEDAWAAYAKSQGIPVIGGSADGGSWTTNSTFFPTSSGALDQITMYEYTTIVAGLHDYGVATCAEIAACSSIGTLSAASQAKSGAKLVSTVKVAAAATDYTAACLTLKNSNAQMVGALSSLDVAGRLIQSCAAQGFKPSFLIGAGTFTPEALTNPIYSGTWVVSPSPLYFSDLPAMTAYRAAMKQYQPSGTLNAIGSAGWVGADVFGQAAASVSDTPTAQDIYKGLYALGANYTDNGLIPPVTFASGQPSKQSKSCAWYSQVNNKQLTTPKGANGICIAN
jgi:branched-chain amino acid transport system substrate-binding protein